jgi:hypothetical protein
MLDFLFNHFLEGLVLFVGILFGFPLRSHALNELLRHLHLCFSDGLFHWYFKFGSVQKYDQICGADGTLILPLDRWMQRDRNGYQTEPNSPFPGE